MLPGVNTKSGPVDRAFLADPTLGSYYAPALVVEAGSGPIQPGDLMGIVTASGHAAAQKRTPVATAIADTTSITSVVVTCASGFAAGDTCDFVDGTDDASELFADIVIDSVDYETDTVTFTAALGAGALDTTDWLRLATADGAETAVGIALDHVTPPDGASITDKVEECRVVVRGIVYSAKVPQINADVYNYATDLKAFTRAGGVLVVGSG